MCVLHVCVCVWSVQCVFVIWRAQGLRHKREREQQCEASRQAGVCVLLVCVNVCVCCVQCCVCSVCVCVLCVQCAVCVCNLEGTGATAQA